MNIKRIVFFVCTVLAICVYASAFNNGYVKYGNINLTFQEKEAVGKWVKDVQYDPQQRMVLEKITQWQYHIDTVGVTYHRVLSTNQYALGLLNTGDDKWVKRASDAVMGAIEQQDTNPLSRTLGVWPYYKEEPLATKRTPADFNMADFNASVLLDIYMYYKDKLPLNTVASIKASLILAAQSIEKRNQGPSYTNIALMGTYVTYMVSHLFDLSEMKTYSENRLRRFYEYTLEKGTFTEYNSPTYTIVAEEQICKMRQHFAEPNAVRMVNQLNDVVWSIIAKHFYQPALQWAGPQSRCYNTLIDQEDYSYLISKATNGRIQLGKLRINPDKVLMKPSLPKKYYSYFTSAKLPQTLNEVFETDVPQVTGTTYMTSTYVLSTANRACLWNQRRPFVAYWGTPASPRYMQVQFLHDNYDFSSSALFTSQRENCVLAGIDLFLYGGDKHLGLDPISSGVVHAKDLRIRFRFGGVANNNLIVAPQAHADSTCFEIDGIKFCMNLFKAKFGNLKGYWEKGGNGQDSWLDFVIYSGEENNFDLRVINEAVWAFTFSVSATGEKIIAAPVSASEDNHLFNCSWKGLSISVPMNMIPRGGFPANL